MPVVESQRWNSTPTKRRVPRAKDGDGRGQVTSLRLRPEVRQAVEELAPHDTLGRVINEALAEWIARRQGTAA